MQFSLNKDVQHTKWQQLRSWTSSPDCLVAMDKQQTQYELIPNGRCSQIIANSNIQVSRHLDSSTTTQMAKIMVQYGRPSRSSWKESVRSWRDSSGKGNLRKSCWNMAGENSKLEMSLCSSWKRIILICVCGWHKIDWKETKSWSDVETTQQRSRFGRTNIFPGPCVLGMHSTTMRNKQRYCGQLQNHVPNFCGREYINYHSLKIFVFLHGLMTWLATKYPLHASMTITSKKKNWNLLDNCHMYALKLCWNDFIWQELDNLIFYGQ